MKVSYDDSRIIEKLNNKKPLGINQGLFYLKHIGNLQYRGSVHKNDILYAKKYIAL